MIILIFVHMMASHRTCRLSVLFFILFSLVFSSDWAISEFLLPHSVFHLISSVVDTLYCIFHFIHWIFQLQNFYLLLLYDFFLCKFQILFMYFFKICLCCNIAHWVSLNSYFEFFFFFNFIDLFLDVLAFVAVRGFSLVGESGSTLVVVH